MCENICLDLKKQSDYQRVNQGIFHSHWKYNQCQRMKLGIHSHISGGSRGCSRCPPQYSPKFSKFHAVFRKIGQNCMLPSPRVGAPSYGEFWIRPCRVSDGAREYPLENTKAGGMHPTGILSCFLIGIAYFPN